MDDSIDVRFGASTDGLTSGITKATGAVSQGVTSMVSNFTALGSVIGKVTGLVGVLVSSLASGALFKASIQESVQLGREVGNLSRQFDLTARQASNLAIAIDDAFLSTEEYQGIAMRLTRQLKSNEDGLQKMGIVTRDNNKQLVSQNDLMFNALDALRGYRAGTDQLAAAQVSLGRGITEEVLQKLFDVQDAFKKTKDDADALGRTMGTENVAASLEYRRAMDNVGDSFQGVRLTIGNALLPVWNVLLGVMADAVATVIPSLSGVMKVLGVTIAFVTELVHGLFQVFKALALNVGQFVGGLTAFLSELAQGNWGGAKAAWSAMTEDMAQSWTDGADAIEARGAKLKKAMKDIWDGPDASADKKVDQPAGRAGTKNFVEPGAAGKQLEEFKRILNLMKQSEGDYRDFSKQAEVDFWATKRSLFAQGTKEWQEVNTLYLQARRAAAKEGVDIARFEYDAQQELATTDTEKKLELTRQWLAKMKTLYGENSQQYRAALKEMTAADKAYVDQQKQFADQRAKSALEGALADLDITRSMLNLRVQMGQLEKEEAYAVQQQIVEARYQLLLEDVERRKALYSDDIVVQQALAAERLAIERNMTKELVEINVGQQQTVFDSWSSMLGGLSGAMENVLYGIITKTITWRQAMQQIVGSLLQTFIKLGVDKVKAWVTSEVLMTSVSRAWNAARAALAATGSAAAVTAKASEATAVIGMNAGEAASGAAASQASIPYVGPILAAAAAAAMLALVLGFNKGGGGGSSTPTVPSAAGGWWDVPGDTLAKIHEREMVMPAPLAEGMREMVESGGTIGASQLHVHAMDADGVKTFLRKHADSLYDVMRGKLKEFPRK